MNAYIIADISVHDPARFKVYFDQVLAILNRHGGKFLVRGGESSVKEGSWNPERLIVIEFTSIGRANAFLDDPDYQSVAAIRHAAACSNLVLVEGCL